MELRIANLLYVQLGCLSTSVYHTHLWLGLMAQLAEDLSLLGLPFLLSKAVEAAAEYEARGCETTASAFVKAATALKSILNHPELAALEENTSNGVIDDSQQQSEGLNPLGKCHSTPISLSAGESLKCQICESKTLLQA